MKKFLYTILLCFVVVIIPIIASACSKSYDYSVQFFAAGKLVETKYYRSGQILDTLPTFSEDCYSLLSWTYEDGKTVAEKDAVLSNMVIHAKLSYTYNKSEDKDISDDVKNNIKHATKLNFSTTSDICVSSKDIEIINELKIKEIDFSGASFDDNEIKAGAFKDNNNIEYIVLPNSLNKIGKETFKNCVNLKTIIFSEGLKNIEDFAFYNVAASDIVLPNSVKTIGKNAFSYCRCLEKVTLGDSLENIDISFIDGSKALNSITVVDCEKYFSDNGSLYLSEVGVDEFGNDIITYKLIRVPEGKSGEFSMYTKTGVIGKYSMLNCSSLTRVVLSSSETSRGAEIEEYALYGCDNVNSVVLSSSLKNIGNFAFYGCEKLTRINLQDTKLESIGKNAFVGDENLNTIILPSTIKSIESGAFYNLRNLSKVEFKDNENELIIKDRAFDKTYYTTNLEIDLSEVVNIVEIGEKAFGTAYVSTMLKDPNMVKVYVHNKMSFDIQFSGDYPNLTYITKQS